jgi:drug/metabolite transporter (DMT)-like permease
MTPHHGRDTSLGVVLGMGAGAAWGLVFVAPKLAGDFSPLQLSAARYLAYGALSLALVAPRWHVLTGHIGPTEWRALLRLSLLGNIVYYILLASAVQLAGVATTSLIIGFLPVAVTLVGSRAHGAVPLRRLLPTLVLGAAAVVCVGWQALAAPSTASWPARLAGLTCALGALASWSAYAVLNSRWLARVRHVGAHDWSLLTGLATGALALLIAVPAFAFSSRHHAGVDWLRFAAVASGVAVAASIVGNALWNRASRLLPLTMIGQMILFETLFALLYGFLWEARWPSALEVLAMVLVGASVVSCVSAHRHAPPATP